MARENEWDYESLRWIHKVREAHYRRTKDLPLEEWLRPVDAETSARACRELGLKVKTSLGRKVRARARL